MSSPEGAIRRIVALDLLPLENPKRTSSLASVSRNLLVSPLGFRLASVFLRRGSPPDKYMFSAVLRSKVLVGMPLSRSLLTLKLWWVEFRPSWHLSWTTQPLSCCLQACNWVALRVRALMRVAPRGRPPHPARAPVRSPPSTAPPVGRAALQTVLPCAGLSPAPRRAPVPRCP